MIEAITAILGLFSAGIFVAHAVDAYSRAIIEEGFNGHGAVVSYLNNVRTTKGTVAP